MPIVDPKTKGSAKDILAEAKVSLLADPETPILSQMKVLSKYPARECAEKKFKELAVSRFDPKRDGSSLQDLLKPIEIPVRGLGGRVLKAIDKARAQVTLGDTKIELCNNAVREIRTEKNSTQVSVTEFFVPTSKDDIRSEETVACYNDGKLMEVKRIDGWRVPGRDFVIDEPENLFTSCDIRRQQCDIIDIDGGFPSEEEKHAGYKY